MSKILVKPAASTGTRHFDVYSTRVSGPQNSNTRGAGRVGAPETSGYGGHPEGYKFSSSVELLSYRISHFFKVAVSAFTSKIFDHNIGMQDTAPRSQESLRCETRDEQENNNKQTGDRQQKKTGLYIPSPLLPITPNINKSLIRGPLTAYTSPAPLEQSEVVANR